MTSSHDVVRPRVRRATPTDDAALRRLSSLAASELRDQRGGEAHLREIGRVDDEVLLDRGADVLLVCELGHTVAGSLSATTVPFAGDAAGGQIRTFYVDPTFRTVGVGQSLLNWVLDYAPEAGWVRLDATALPGDRATKNFFESAGLTTRRLVVSIDLR